MSRRRKAERDAPPDPPVAPELLAELERVWQASWPKAIDCWSRYTKLSEPRWCKSVEQEKAEQLSGSFAMIRLVDHAVVISLRQVALKGLEKFAVEILAHEIGHHVYTPADLTDNARLLARTRRGLPSREAHAPLVANLYADLLINDRLQRMMGLDMASVYRALGKSPGKLWRLYMRIYELLWQLDRGTLADGDLYAKLNLDAQLGARLVRSYATEWLDGAGRFAALCLPYLLEDVVQERAGLGGWCDTGEAGRGGLPEGLAEIDTGELEGAIHPALDPELSGVPNNDKSDRTSPNPTGCETGPGGRKSQRQYRDPVSYADVLLASGVQMSREDLISRYYRERAMPYLISFPSQNQPRAIDPLPEGTDLWDVGNPVDQIDWMSTLLTSPIVIPGVTTRERAYGQSPGTTPEKIPVDLYLGVDCSGSMPNPAYSLSYPVVAGAILILSALRAGSHVMVALSGEPGRTVTTDGFIRDEAAVLKTLTGYLGSGYSFGIHRLAEVFAHRPKDARPAHILIVSDGDIFSILETEAGGKRGWDVAREAAAAARGGATYVLQINAKTYASQIQRMNADGWHVSTVATQDELVEFARVFSRRTFGAATPRR